MKKIIYERKAKIVYSGNINELKDQMKYLIQNHSDFQIMFSEGNFEKFWEMMPLQTMNERLDYDRGEIIYGPNGSPEDYKFLRINYYSNKADEKFIEKYSKNDLEILISGE